MIRLEHLFAKLTGKFSKEMIENPEVRQWLYGPFKLSINGKKYGSREFGREDGDLSGILDIPRKHFADLKSLIEALEVKKKEVLAQKKEIEEIEALKSESMNKKPEVRNKQIAARKKELEARKKELETQDKALEAQYIDPNIRPNTYTLILPQLLSLEDMKALNEYLKTCNIITGLKLADHSFLGPKLMNEICIGLDNNKSITTFVLGNCFAYDEAELDELRRKLSAKFTRDKLSSPRHLPTTYYLDRYKFSWLYRKSRTSTMQNCCSCFLSCGALCHCCVGLPLRTKTRHTLRIMLSFVERNQSITSLHIYYETFDLKNWFSLICKTLAKNTTVQKFSLLGFRDILSNENLIEFSNMLRVNKSLTNIDVGGIDHNKFINIRYSDIDPKNWGHLLDSLKIHSNLEWIDLEPLDNSVQARELRDQMLSICRSNSRIKKQIALLMGFENHFSNHSPLRSFRTDALFDRNLVKILFDFNNLSKKQLNPEQENQYKTEQENQCNTEQENQCNTEKDQAKLESSDHIEKSKLKVE